MKQITFKQFKAIIVKRCKANSACEGEFIKVINATTFAELVPILTNNFKWCCSNNIFTGNILLQVSADDINQHGLYCNASTNIGYLFTSGSATVEASGRSTVVASGSATVRASGRSTVEAYGSATVRASGRSTVEAYDSATVVAYGSATVVAYDSATVEAYGSATVRASGSATVRASGRSTVEAYDSAMVRASGRSTVRASGRSTVEAYDSATVEAYDSAYICSYSNIEHKLNDKSICRYCFSNLIKVSITSTINSY